MGIDSVKSGQVAKIYFKEGDAVRTDEVVLAIDTDKITVEVKAPEDGIITKIYAVTDEKIDEGAVAFEYKAGAVPKAEKKTPSKSPESPKEEKKVETKKEEKKTETKKEEKPQPKASPQAPPQAPPGSRIETRQKRKPIRVRIAKRLKESQNEYAMLTTFQKVDMHDFMQIRTKLGEEFLKKHGVKLGFMSAFVKASSHGLKAFPLVNAVIDGQDIVYRDYHDISVAVATPKGLVVPVLRNVHSMSFADVEKSLNDLAVKARDNQLAVEDMSGGTFTISNGGVYGSLMGTPIINPPQSAILGMHAINKEAHVVNDEIKIRPIMVIALTYDHRIIDGREAVLFLRTIKSCIEDPNRMLLDI